ncbi:phosphonopyruvate decarboxylase [Treponema primitia ZAS-2]|uniref:Phosphonopyruvate decarboxylase n=1 Tax=Treponema primitia (strain ATCC BAA-887 / DSM 12427 / ZAS-2) TaxID=545694 RepID=F5YHL4_TREPZ|nr:phosphonopyruvate decarboxylase [Treponema primitia]AEF86847.1 phosphonopyruvate decarboxylase [Treponema primitia ZAS-2]
MIEAQLFYDILSEKGTGFFTGVPDSLLKSFCAYITDHAGYNSHIIAVNEGAALALASGYHIASGKIPLVYMQNSGIGNAINPLLSLADADVYRIPMLLLIGWRGEPGVKDEPQHLKQGKVTLSLLEAMGIPYFILSQNEGEFRQQIDQCFASIKEKNTPHALVIRKDTFAPYTLVKKEADEGELTREAAIEEVIRASDPEEIYFSTTGMASRELYEIRERLGQGHGRDFLTVGSMGHASQIALGAALQKPNQPITVLDGDGALLMHMGALAAIGNRKPEHFRHIILNNGAHDSVGGQPTLGLKIDIPSIARACGYRESCTVKSAEELRAVLGQKRHGPVLIEIRVRKGARKDLGRPASSPQENKKVLMGILND